MGRIECVTAGFAYHYKTDPYRLDCYPDDALDKLARRRMTPWGKDHESETIDELLIGTPLSGATAHWHAEIVKGTAALFALDDCGIVRFAGPPWQVR